MMGMLSNEFKSFRYSGFDFEKISTSEYQIYDENKNHVGGLLLNNIGFTGYVLREGEKNECISIPAPDKMSWGFLKGLASSLLVFLNDEKRNEFYRHQLKNTFIKTVEKDPEGIGGLIEVPLSNDGRVVNILFANKVVAAITCSETTITINFLPTFCRNTYTIDSKNEDEIRKTYLRLVSIKMLSM